MKILVFQQGGSGKTKIDGIKAYGGPGFQVDMISIDIPLPPVIDDAREFLPKEIEADLVLDFLKHPDLSYDLAKLCAKKEIPVIASGKKIREKGVISPPT
jgi:thymidylate synthase